MAALNLSLLGVGAALSAAVFFALSRVYARMGFQSGSPRTAHRVSLIMNLLILWPAALVYTLLFPAEVPFMAVLYFVLAGLAGSGLGRLFSFMGIERIGVAESSPLVSLSPFFAALLAISILGERMTLNIALGTGLVILGLLLLSQYQVSRYRWTGIIATLFSAFFFGLGDMLRKLALTYVANPPLGAAIGSTAALFMFYSYAAEKPRIALPTMSGANRYFVLSGVTTSLALLMTFSAYSLTQLIVASPLISTAPLFALFFTYLMLRGMEELRTRTVLSALIVMAGIVSIITG